MIPENVRYYLAECDAIHGMTLLPSESVDVVVTSPPYNIGTKYLTYKDQQSRPAYWDWTRKWTSEVQRVLKPYGSFFLNISGPPSDRMFPHEVLYQLMPWKFHLQNEIHWIKSVAIDGVQKGHYKPINSTAYLNCCHEYLFHLTKKGNVGLDRLAVGVGYTDMTNITRWSRAAGGKHCAGNTWFMPYKTIQNKGERGHPATFPLELPTRCILLHGLGDRAHRRELFVLDPFCGSGTTLVAAAMLGTMGLGMEIDPEYCKMAAGRVFKETGETVAIGRPTDEMPGM